MKKLLLSLLILFTMQGLALEYEILIQNEKVCVSRVKIMPGEIIDDHYDQYPQVVVAVHEGIITRLEADGSTIDVHFPLNTPVFRPSESADKMHKSVNKQQEPIELIITQILK